MVNTRQPKKDGCHNFKYMKYKTFDEQFNVFGECNPPHCKNIRWGGNFQELREYILSLITSMSSEIQTKFKKSIEKYIDDNNFMLPDSDTIELLLREDFKKIADKYKEKI